MGWDDDPTWLRRSKEIAGTVLFALLLPLILVGLALWRVWHWWKRKDW